MQILSRGFTWQDAGTFDSLLEAATLVSMIEKRQGILISAPEEIAFINGWISREQLAAAAEKYKNSAYGRHLRAVAESRIRY